MKKIYITKENNQYEYFEDRNNYKKLKDEGKKVIIRLLGDNEYCKLEEMEDGLQEELSYLYDINKKRFNY